MIPQKVWPHLGVPTESIKARGVRLRWLYVRGSFDDPCSAKKIHHLAEDVSLARWCPRRSFFRGSHFSSALCSVFALCSSCVASVTQSGHFEVRNVVLRDRCRTSSTFWSVAFCGSFKKTVAGFGSKWEVLVEVMSCGRRSTFLEFETVENCVLWADLIWGMTNPCGRRRTSDAPGSFFSAGAVFCRLQQQRLRLKSRFLDFLC